MDSLKFHDVLEEKPKADAKYCRIQRITSFFRFMELLLVLIALSHFSSSLNLSGEYFRRVSFASMVSPGSVFVVGNAIVIVLFLLSDQFSGNKAERSKDFYDEYVERCRNNRKPEVRRACGSEVKVMGRSQSEVGGRERRRELRRSMSEKSGGCGYSKEEMSGEEFRRTVEAFIARQQRSLREEEEYSGVVSF